MSIPLSKNWEQVERIEDLKVGDFIRHVSLSLGDESLIVTAVYGSRATAVRTADLTNATEWLVLRDKKRV